MILKKWLKYLIIFSIITFFIYGIVSYPISVDKAFLNCKELINENKDYNNYINSVYNGKGIWKSIKIKNKKKVLKYIKDYKRCF